MTDLAEIKVTGGKSNLGTRHPQKALRRRFAERLVVHLRWQVDAIGKNRFTWMALITMPLRFMDVHYSQGCTTVDWEGF
jgi:hypothetical protein